MVFPHLCRRCQFQRCDGDHSLNIAPVGILGRRRRLSCVGYPLCVIFCCAILGIILPLYFRFPGRRGLLHRSAGDRPLKIAPLGMPGRRRRRSFLFLLAFGYFGVALFGVIFSRYFVVSGRRGHFQRSAGGRSLQIAPIRILGLRRRRSYFAAVFRLLILALCSLGYIFYGISASLSALPISALRW